MKTRIFCLVAAMVATVFAGCQKEDYGWEGTDEVLCKQGTKDEPSSYPRYSTLAALWAELQSILNSDSLAQRASRGATTGTPSAGSEADRLCTSICTAGFADGDDAIDFYQRHTDLLDTLHIDSIVVVVPRWHDNPLRYLADTNGLFVVSNTVYRLVRNGVASADISLAQALADLDESQLPFVDSSEFRFTPLESSVKRIAGLTVYANEYAVPADASVMERSAMTLWTDSGDLLPVKAAAAMKLQGTDRVFVVGRVGFVHRPSRTADSPAEAIGTAVPR